MAIQDEFIGNLRNTNNAKKTETKKTESNSNGAFAKAAQAVKDTVAKAGSEKSSQKPAAQPKSEKQKLNDFISKYRAASSETKVAIKSRLEADDTAGKFINSFRNADDATKNRIVNKLVNGSEQDAATMNNILKGALGDDRSQLGPSGDNFGNQVTMNTQPQEPQQPQPQLTAPTNQEAPQGAPQEGPGATGYDATNDVYEYTYKPGDTFGRVIMNMGLADGRNLWGPDGDVAYYTKQLNDQGIYGNIPVGTTIKLRRRPRKS